MKKCYLDSNVLVYYKDENSPHQQKASNLISSLMPEEYELYLSSLVIDEFIHSLLFILKQNKIQPAEKFRRLDEGLSSILQFQHVRIINPSSSKESNMRMIDMMRDFHLNPRDAYHLLIMQENGIEEFATFDNDFRYVFRGKVLYKAE